MELKPGYYKHYKGNIYNLIVIANHSETLEKMVVYQGMYDDQDFGDKPIWVRPYELFTGEVVINGKSIKRFQYLGVIYPAVSEEDNSEGEKVT